MGGDLGDYIYRSIYFIGEGRRVSYLLESTRFISFNRWLEGRGKKSYDIKLLKISCKCPVRSPKPV